MAERSRPHRLQLLLSLLAPLFSVALLTAVDAAIVRYNLTITTGWKSPDCVSRQVYLINGQYPGPTLTATAGDTLIVRVTNGLHVEGTAVHWHGIRQLNSNLMDGAAYITQCPILPKETMTYQFLADKAGTFMYHSHLNIQSTGGLYGQLIVYDPPSRPFRHAYDGELSVIVNDWFHLSVPEQLAELSDGGWVGNPQSLLLNGKGKYNCSQVPPGFDRVVGDVKVCNALNPQCAYEVFEVEKGKSYRFRIASIASLSSLNLALEKHTLRVVAADAYMVQPFDVATKGLDIYGGQTVDVILHANQRVGNYWVRTAVFGLAPPTPFGLAILRYKGAPKTLPTTQPPRMRGDTVTPSYNQATRYRAWTAAAGGDTPAVVKPANVSRVVLVNSQQFIDGFVRWAINNVSLADPATPFALGLAVKSPKSLVDAIAAEYSPPPSQIPFKPWNYSAPPPTEARYASNYYQYPLGATVDIVLQNTYGLFGPSEYHPWHMHGAHFWVLGYGFGTFQWSRDVPKFNLVDPPYRNTVTMLPDGWTALRLKVDNPGAWLFHCHLNFHKREGMEVVIVAGSNFNIPPNTRKCGLLY